MQPKTLPCFWRVAAGAAFVLSLSVALAAKSAAQFFDSPQRVSFQISTGSTTGTYFPVGELFAELLSHPPGVGRCVIANICGPAGLIVSARASEGSVANVLSVNSGAVSSGLAQADVVAMAVAGQGPFRRNGPARQLRVIANLYGEDIHLVAAKNANIKSVADLRGKRVSLSTEGSGTIITARAILTAYRLSERSIQPNYDSAERASDLLQEGRLDALFFVGGTPVNLIQQMLDEDVAALVPINGAGRTRLLAREPYLSAHTIPQGTYGSSPAVDTVAVDALWITDAAAPEALVYGMLKALYNPVNRARIDTQRAGTHFIELDSGIKAATAALHPGATRFFTESGIIKPTPPAAPRR